MKFRIFWKTFTMARRSGKRFLVFVIIYAFLIATTAYFMQQAWLNPNTLFTWFTVLVVISAVILSSLYGFLISNYRKREIATLRTIGWDAGSIRLLFLSELILVFVSSFIIVLEVIFHVVAVTYWANPTSPPVALESVIINPVILIITVAIIIGCQIPGMLLGYWKILKIRPMEAMRKA